MKLVVGNFKMNLLKDDILLYLDSLNDSKMTFSNVVFCPPHIYLSEFINRGYTVGSQDISMEEGGPYTGDVSARQLKSIGVTYAIIGHSERRKFYNDNKYVSKKIKMCCDNGLVPILCIGENQNDYNNAQTKNILMHEIDEALEGVLNINNLYIAYEPIWAIGSGIIPCIDEIDDIVKFIKEYVYNKYRFNIKVLYGGSVSLKNIDELLKINSTDGYLVGGESLNSIKFCQLISKINKI